MQALQAIEKAVLASHRWLMKYSGMTMIIDNVEERRRGHQDEDPPPQDPNPRVKEGPSRERSDRTPSTGPD